MRLDLFCQPANSPSKHKLQPHPNSEVDNVCGRLASARGFYQNYQQYHYEDLRENMMSIVVGYCLNSFPTLRKEKMDTSKCFYTVDMRSSFFSSLLILFAHLLALLRDDWGAQRTPRFGKPSAIDFLNTLVDLSCLKLNRRWHFILLFRQLWAIPPRSPMSIHDIIWSVRRNPTVL